MLPPGIKIVPATIEDREEIYQHLCNEFFDNEPLNKILTRKYPDLPLPAIDECRSINSLDHNLSFKAISTDNQINGVVLCREISRGVNAFPKYNNTRLEHISGLIEGAGLKYGTIWDHVPPEVDSIGLICVISVAKKCQGLGIASQLLQVAKNKLRLHFQVALIECSNPSMARISQKTMVHMASAPFNEYKDSDGVVVFDNPPPENSLNFFYEIF